MIFQNLHPQSKIWLYISPVSIDSVTKKNISSKRKIEIKNLEILLEINEYLIARIAIKANFDSILKESGLKRIEVT